MSTQTADPVIEKLLPILRQHLKVADATQAFPLDKKLEELGLDSMGAINLFLDIEDSFDVAFPAELLTEETFRTATTLATAVGSLVGGS